MSQLVIVEEKNKIATLTLNEAERDNTYNEEMALALCKVTKKLSERQDLRLVVLKANGPIFMAGGDIHFFYEQQENLRVKGPKLFKCLADTICYIQTIAAPVACVVHGAVAGVGLSFMLACDLVYALSNTKFSTAYSNIGLSPDGGLSYFLPRIIGKQRAMELLMLGSEFDAEAAY